MKCTGYEGKWYLLSDLTRNNNQHLNRGIMLTLKCFVWSSNMALMWGHVQLSAAYHQICSHQDRAKAWNKLDLFLIFFYAYNTESLAHEHRFFLYIAFWVTHLIGSELDMNVLFLKFCMTLWNDLLWTDSVWINWIEKDCRDFLSSRKWGERSWMSQHAADTVFYFLFSLIWCHSFTSLCFSLFLIHLIFKMEKLSKN